MTQQARVGWTQYIPDGSACFRKGRLDVTKGGPVTERCCLLVPPAGAGGGGRGLERA